MTLNLHSLKSKERRKKKRLGRGNASGHGTYSTRGIKGQKSRSGGRRRPSFGLNLAKHLPKSRGVKSLFPKLAVVNIQEINSRFKDGDAVNPALLRKAGLIDNIKLGVKILGQGSLRVKNLKIEGCKVSASAKTQIEKMGGKIKLPHRQSADQGGSKN